MTESIPDIVLNGVKIPEGYEATGEYRKPVSGEWGMSLIDEEPFLFVNGTGSSEYRRIILRKRFAWPDWVIPGTWYATDEDGGEWLFNTEPKLMNEQREWVGTLREGRSWRLEDIRTIFDFPPVHVTDWRNSKMQKPIGYSGTFTDVPTPGSLFKLTHEMMQGFTSDDWIQLQIVADDLWDRRKRLADRSLK